MIKALVTVLICCPFQQLRAASLPQDFLRLLSASQPIESLSVIPSPIPLVPSPAAPPGQSPEERELQLALYGEVKNARKVLATVHKDIAEHQAWISGLKDKLKACNASYGIAMKEIQAYAAEEAANAKHVQEVLLQRKLDASIKANLSKEESLQQDEEKYGNTSAAPEQLGEQPVISPPAKASSPDAKIDSQGLETKKKFSPNIGEVDPAQSNTQPDSYPSAPIPIPALEKDLKSPVEKEEEEIPSIEELRDELKVIRDQHKELLKLKAELLVEVNILRKSFQSIMDIITFWQQHKDEKKRGLLKAADKEEDDSKKVKEAYVKMLEVNRMLSKPEGDDAIE